MSDTAEQNKDFKTGFVGIVGPTNSGKSTLMNALMGKKISIVSSKVQTTYHGVRGILNRENEQMVLTDTPGFQGHREPIAQLLNKIADQNARDCDLLAWVFDASSPRMIGQLHKLRDRIALKKPELSICVLNKVDLVAKPKLLPLIEEIAMLAIFSDIVPLSAKSGIGVDRLAALFRERLPQGEPMYPKDMVTDRSDKFLIAELIREKIYRDTHQEVPYSARVEIEDPSPEEAESRVPVVRAVIHVDSQSRRGILIGKGGLMLKKIGTEARLEIEKLLGKHICLKLHVDVENQWKSDSRILGNYLELQ